MVLASAGPDWSKPGAAYLAIAREELAAQRASMQTKTGGHPPGPPKPVQREWAIGSVEWQREQAGEVVPHPPREKPASLPIDGSARDADEQIRELFQATLR
jgi:hypothetical protein